MKHTNKNHKRRNNKKRQTKKCNRGGGGGEVEGEGDLVRERLETEAEKIFNELKPEGEGDNKYLNLVKYDEANKIIRERSIGKRLPVSTEVAGSGMKVDLYEFTAAYYFMMAQKWKDGSSALKEEQYAELQRWLPKFKETSFKQVRKVNSDDLYFLDFFPLYKEKYPPPPTTGGRRRKRSTRNKRKTNKKRRTVKRRKSAKRSHRRK